MQRYFVKNISDNNIEFLDSDIHHIKNVMRFHSGEKIQCVFEATLYDCIIDSIDPLNVSVLKKHEVENKDDISVVIGIPLVVEQKMDFILQKATELGASEIFIIDCERSKVKLDNVKFLKKLERWNKIVKEASEQSYRLDIPKISGIYKIKDLKDFEGLKLVCSTSECISLKKTLKNDYKCGKILIVAGPEGGLSNVEENLLVNNGFTRVSLGKNILRIETVPLCVLSFINYEFME